MQSFFVVGVAQLVEHQVVALVAAGSIPVTHPTKSSKAADRLLFLLVKCVVPAKVYRHILWKGLTARWSSVFLCMLIITSLTPSTFSAMIFISSAA